MKNKSGIQATEYKVLVKPDEVENEIVSKFEGLAKAGFKIPDEHLSQRQAAATKGVIVDVSPLAFKYDNWPSDERIPKVGSRVAFARYAGVSLEGSDREIYRLINDKDVIAILRHP